MLKLIKKTFVLNTIFTQMTLNKLWRTIFQPRNNLIPEDGPLSRNIVRIICLLCSQQLSYNANPQHVCFANSKAAARLYFDDAYFIFDKCSELKAIDNTDARSIFHRFFRWGPSKLIGLLRPVPISFDYWSKITCYFSQGHPKPITKPTKF